MKTLLLALIVFLSFALAGYAGENPGQQKKTTHTQAAKAVPCSPGTAVTDIDIGNVRAKMLVGGDMWWDFVNPGYEVPKGSGKHSLYAGAIWFGGIDAGSQIHVAAQSYRQTGNDFWPGPVDTVNVTTDAAVCTAYDKIWKVTRAEVINFVQNGITTPDILSWPGNGNASLNHAHFLAPFYDDNGDGVYDPAAGDYPFYDLANSGVNCCNVLQGDQSLWWAFNDVGNIHTETGSPQIGLEIRAQTFAYNSGIPDIDNATFNQYIIINRSTSTYTDCYFGQWVDCDLGNAMDDYVGCDVTRGLGYCYNADQNDDGAYGYGLNPPAIGVDFLHGPLADPGDGIDNNRNGIIDEAGEDIIMSYFQTYNNVNNAPTGNPNGFDDFYNYIHGVWLDGISLTYGEDGRNPSNPVCNFMYPDDTDSALNASNGAWTEVIAGNMPHDRRFVQSAGPFTFLPGQVECITVGIPWARDTSGAVPPSLAALKQADDVIQQLFDNCFVLMGMDDIESNPFGMSVSPVPFNLQAMVSFTNKNGEVFTLTVYDIKGREVRSIKNISGNSVIVNRQSMKSGIYLFSLKDRNGKTATQKVAVE